MDVQFDAVLDGRVDVAVGIGLQELPHRVVARERGFARLAGGVEQEGDDRVAAHVAGDVLLRIVRAHLFLVDVLLEDEAEHVRVDLVIVAQRAFVQMPLILIEIIEDALERAIGNLDSTVGLLDDVRLKKTAIQVGDAAEQVLEFRRAGLAAQPFMEQSQQEVAVERVKFIPPLFLLTALEPVAQVMRVPIQKAFALDEIDEHEAVEHDRTVPGAIRRHVNAFHEREETGMLLFELVVEAFGDALHIETFARAGDHVHQCQRFFFRQGKGDIFQLLNERFAGLVAVQGMFAAGRGFAGFTFDPLPNLGGPRRVGENDQMFMRRPGDLLLNFSPQRVSGEAFAIRRGELEGHHAAFVGDGRERVWLAIHDDFCWCGRVVPAQPFNEQLPEIEVAEVLLDAGFVHRSSSGTALPPAR
ncbi:MAG: hypothetical protein BWX84_01071 [Verrucomicrobia bacterium ADurb.Bin118]|nr:MAG: hypothetical protein BWX84_01071 [Verrucomicrobia bacterium ADurb.Bin118]